MDGLREGSDGPVNDTTKPLVGDGVYASLIRFLGELRRQHISYELDDVTGVIMVRAFVLGTIWEFEFLPCGSVEVERFITTHFVDRPFNEKGLDTLDFFVALYGCVSGETAEVMEHVRALYPTLYPSFLQVLSERDPVRLRAEGPGLDDNLHERYTPTVEFILTYLWADETPDKAFDTVYHALGQAQGWDRVGAREEYVGVASALWEQWIQAGGAGSAREGRQNR